MDTNEYRMYKNIANRQLAIVTDEARFFMLPSLNLCRTQ